MDCDPSWVQNQLFPDLPASVHLSEPQSSESLTWEQEGLWVRREDKKWPQGCEDIGPVVHCPWDHKKVQPLWRSLVGPPKGKLPCDPAIPLLGADPERLKAGTWTDICTMSITALPTAAEGGVGQCECPSTEKQMNKTWSIHTLNIIQPPKEGSSDSNHLDEPCKHELKSPVIRGQVLSDSTFLRDLEKGTL